MATPDVNQDLAGITEERRGQISAAEGLAASTDATRNKLAERVVHYYFGIMIIIIVGVPVYNYLMAGVFRQPGVLISIKDAILTYSAVVGPTFGLVVAYYFKSNEQ